jgi:hypothetical protein
MPTVADLIKALQEIRVLEGEPLQDLKEAVEYENLARVGTATKIQINDHVRILNPIRPRSNKAGVLMKITKEDRAGTVTKVYEDRDKIELTTYTGIKTWRQRKHLSLIKRYDLENSNAKNEKTEDPREKVRDCDIKEKDNNNNNDQKYNLDATDAAKCLDDIPKRDCDTR